MKKLRRNCLEGAGQTQMTQQRAPLTHDEEANGKNQRIVIQQPVQLSAEALMKSI